jgi:transcriptional regulator with XRE-family HTH domain
MTDEPTKYFFRQRQQNRLYDVVIRAVELSGMRRKEIAKKLGVPPSQITRLLSGPSNWTSDTTSDLLFAVDAELDFQAVQFCDRAKGNRFHPAGEVFLPPSRSDATTTPAPELTWRSERSSPPASLVSPNVAVVLHVAAE